MTITNQILKIESNGEVLLLSKSAVQQIFPIKPKQIKRNLNLEIVSKRHVLKYKCCIETADVLNMNLLNQDRKFLIHSVCKIFESGVEKPSVDFVADSIQIKNGGVEYCPILSVELVNFKYKSSSKSWVLEFEDV